MGTAVVTPKGDGVVVGASRQKSTVKVKLVENGEIEEFPAEEVDVKES
jgi:hypothetical protein